MFDDKKKINMAQNTLPMNYQKLNKQAITYSLGKRPMQNNQYQKYEAHRILNGNYFIYTFAYNFIITFFHRE